MGWFETVAFISTQQCKLGHEYVAMVINDTMIMMISMVIQWVFINVQA